MDRDYPYNLVARGDDVETVMADLRALVANVQANPIKMTGSATQAVQTPSRSFQNVPDVTDNLIGTPCPKCGAPMRRSKKGNVVCSEACWLK